MARNRGILAAAVCCTILSAAFAAQDAILPTTDLSSVPGVTRLPTPFQLQESESKDLVQHQMQHEQPLQAVDAKDMGNFYSNMLVTHRLDESTRHPAPIEHQEGLFPAPQKQQAAQQQTQHNPEDADHLHDLDFDLKYPAKPASLRMLSQDGASSAEDLTDVDPEEPVCAYYSNEVNNYINQGWRVKFTQFATPEKCPESCKTDYRGPATGTYDMQCNAAKCFCTFSNGGWHYKNVVMKDTGALSIVGAMPAGCPKGDCVGGGFEFCQPGGDC